MYPRWHILFGLIFSIAVYLLFPITLLQASIIFLSSILIDIDHYLFYVKRKKDFSLPKAYRWHIHLGKIKANKKKSAMMFMHTIEFLILIAILSYFFNIFIYILIGLLFHMILDMLHHLQSKEYSLIRYIIIKNKHPERYI